MRIFYQALIQEDGAPKRNRLVCSEDGSLMKQNFEKDEED